MLRPCSMLTCWALISHASALLAARAQSLLPAASLAPSPSSCRRSSSSLAWPCTAAKERRRRRNPTSQAIWAALDLKRRHWLGCVPAVPTFASASFWTRVWTSSLASPHAPKTQPLTCPKVLSLVSGVSILRYFSRTLLIIYCWFYKKLGPFYKKLNCETMVTDHRPERTTMHLRTTYKALKRHLSACTL